MEWTELHSAGSEGNVRSMRCSVWSSAMRAGVDAGWRIHGQAMREIDFGETCIDRENFEAMQGFHAGVRKSGIGGADGKHGLYEYTHTHVVYLQS